MKIEVNQNLSVLTVDGVEYQATKEIRDCLGCAFEAIGNECLIKDRDNRYCCTSFGRGFGEWVIWQRKG